MSWPESIDIMRTWSSSLIHATKHLLLLAKMPRPSGQSRAKPEDSATSESGLLKVSFSFLSQYSASVFRSSAGGGPRLLEPGSGK